MSHHARAANTPTAITTTQKTHHRTGRSGVAMVSTATDFSLRLRRLDYSQKKTTYSASHAAATNSQNRTPASTSQWFA